MIYFCSFIIRPVIPLFRRKYSILFYKHEQAFIFLEKYIFIKKKGVMPSFLSYSVQPALRIIFFQLFRSVCQQFHFMDSEQVCFHLLIAKRSFTGNNNICGIDILPIFLNSEIKMRSRGKSC